MEKLTKNNIKNLDLCCVEITDINNQKDKGWLVIKNNDYLLLPLVSKWYRRIYKISHIKSIRVLTNGMEYKRL